MHLVVRVCVPPPHWREQADQLVGVDHAVGQVLVLQDRLDTGLELVAAAVQKELETVSFTLPVVARQ
jgi:hypothetical protein